MFTTSICDRGHAIRELISGDSHMRNRMTLAASSIVVLVVAASGLGVQSGQRPDRARPRDGPRDRPSEGQGRRMPEQAGRINAARQPLVLPPRAPERPALLVSRPREPEDAAGRAHRAGGAADARNARRLQNDARRRAAAAAASEQAARGRGSGTSANATAANAAIPTHRPPLRKPTLARPPRSSFPRAGPPFRTALVSNDRDVTTAVADNTDAPSTRSRRRRRRRRTRRKRCRWCGQRSRLTNARPRRSQPNPRPASDIC